MTFRASLLSVAMIMAACGGGGSSTGPPGEGGAGGATVGGGGSGGADLDSCLVVETQFRDLADIQKYTIARSCASQNDVCHNDEDPPPMHNVGMVWNMVGMPCNTGLVEYDEWDEFCKRAEDGGSDGLVVNPGNAADSYLMIRLRGGTRTSRVQMPNGAPELSAGELYAIAAWINTLVPGESSSADPIDYQKTPCPL